MVEPIERSADFERVLRTATRSRSVHFAAHHLGEPPSIPARALKSALAAKLSTTDLLSGQPPVDDSAGPVQATPLQRRWFGIVVPKRHARRSVTRSLLKRQIRAAVARRGDALPPGLWVIRLRAPFDMAQFPSAASHALRDAAHAELEHLLTHAAQARGRPR